MKNIFIVLLVALSFNATAECIEESYRLQVANDFLWVMKGRKDITEETYQSAYKVYELVKFDYNKCVSNEKLANASKD